MATQTAPRTPLAEQTDSPATPLGEIQAHIQALHAKKKIDAVRDEALTLATKLQRTEQHLQQLSSHQQDLSKHQLALREKLETLTEPEHYPVTVTAVERNGQLLVEVAGLGTPRVQVGVHPDVDPETLLVGATAIVSHERNCLLKVIARTSRWQAVGTFERYLDSPDRILVRDRETLLALDVAHDLRNTTLKKSDLVGFDRDVAGIAFARLQPPPSNHLFDEDVTDDFSQLGGLDKEIARITEIVGFRIRNSHLAQKYALKSKCGILLKGSPGNGKTRIARCTAGFIRDLVPDKPCRFMHIAGSSDYNEFFGASERNITDRFTAIREAAVDGPVVVFWDEIDAIAKQRGSDRGSGAPDRILNTLLSQIDGVVPLTNVVMLFATNRADTLDQGFVRPGRIDEKIEIPSPNRRAVQAILRCYLGRGLPLARANADELIAPLVSRLFAPNGDYREVAEVKLSDGRRLPVAGHQLISGAMLETIVNSAAQRAAVREAETGQEGLTEADLALMLETELINAVSLLAPVNVKGYLNTIPQDAQPIAVNPLLTSSPSTYRR